MLRKLISTALRRETETETGDIAREGSARPPDLAFPPMRPVEPPAARNDNPLAALCEAVEADLRAAGYLR
ncbi:MULTISPECIES: hypothetical protein [unclassified Methylobacterium]|uniref:hypothetical protein n=1 Tax=unclassified Methylobacterium TaxID=2615210 RepID=UPI0006F204FE|nr:MULTISPECIES: hypothetical protein [unclassified Methylobacterium]KQO63256.1 hypothetical protein ASF20_07580 [Methylobacterium sp. Leaf88]KQO69319.1 hypothetical protein ASF18_02505 [Methylobacterium sp. Leaf89]KQP52365.1 hypothetical protein ASF41_11920 [Methylobacterium sp. Leaf111]KQT71480.1 hypothetical protein ASG51_11170 [Methylobacterium sp. Leaf465]KQU34060.1 hypothetical protein ASG63_13555 [Methylobacterium sp. Leaf94]